MGAEPQNFETAAYFQPKSPPDEILGAEADIRIRAALRNAILASPEPVSQPPRPRDIVEVTIRAAIALRKDVQGGFLALRLLKSLPDNLQKWIAVAFQKCVTLKLTDNIEELVEEINRQLAADPIDPKNDERFVNLARTANVAWLVAPVARLASKLQFDLKDNPSDWMAVKEPEDLSAQPFEPNLLKKYLFATGQAMSDALLEQLQSGRSIYRKCTALFSAQTYSRRLSEKAMISEESKHRIETLFDAVLNDLIRTDDSAVQAALAAGRNVIALHVHAGIPFGPHVFQGLTVPQVLIGRSPENFLRKNGSAFSIRTISTLNQANLSMEFVGLAKSLRKEQMLVSVYPDGPDGSSFCYRMVLGHRVRIATGGAFLARMNDSALFMVHCRLRDGFFETVTIPGPLIDRSMSAEEAETKFADFYAAELENLLAGPAEDLGQLYFLEGFDPLDGE
jgi:hypothetical protein